MLEPSAHNPLPWHKRCMANAEKPPGTFLSLWAIYDAEGKQVFCIYDVVSGEQTADFIIAMAEMAAGFVWMEVDSERARQRGNGR
jgi:hypothetical protein